MNMDKAGLCSLWIHSHAHQLRWHGIMAAVWVLSPQEAHVVRDTGLLSCRSQLWP